MYHIFTRHSHEWKQRSALLDSRCEKCCGEALPCGQDLLFSSASCCPVCEADPMEHSSGLLWLWLLGGFGQGVSEGFGQGVSEEFGPSLGLAKEQSEVTHFQTSTPLSKWPLLHSPGHWWCSGTSGLELLTLLRVLCPYTLYGSSSKCLHLRAICFCWNQDRYTREILGEQEFWWGVYAVRSLSPHC